VLPGGFRLSGAEQVRVLADPDGPLENIVPAKRPVTLRDLLTFTLGTGIVVAEPGTVPIADALNALQSDEPGPPPDEWIRRLGALPLVYQPGTPAGTTICARLGRQLRMARRIRRVLSRPSVTLMTSDHLTPAQKAVSWFGTRLARVRGARAGCGPTARNPSRCRQSSLAALPRT
jgi:hypothetical protein